jgi:hypothetical protein
MAIKSVGITIALLIVPPEMPEPIERAAGFGCM